MPLPVLAGIPWLAGLLGGLFSSLFTFFATYFTKRLAIVAAAVVIITTLTVGLFTALQALVTGIALTLPSEFVAMSGHFVPPHAMEYVSAVVSAQLLRYAYDWNVRVAQYKML